MRYLVLGERPQELCDLILQDLADDKDRYACLAFAAVPLCVDASCAHAALLLFGCSFLGGGSGGNGVCGRFWSVS